MQCEMEFWLFNKIVNALAVIKDEVVLNFTKEGLKVRMMDEPKVILMHMEIPAEAFKSYEPLGELVKISMSYLKKRLRGNIKDVNVAAIEVDLMKSNQFKIDIATPHGHRVVGVPIFADLTEDEKIPIPKLQKVRKSDATVKLFMNAISDAAGDAEHVDKACHFEARSDPDRFVIWAMKAGDFISSWTEFEDGKSMMGLKTDFPKVRTGVPLAYLKAVLVAGSPFSDVARVGFSDDFPVVLDLQLPFEGILKFTIAPWVDKD